MNNSYVLFIPMAIAIAGCTSPAPVAQNFPMTYQRVARTAHHWDVVADDVVAQTLQAMADKPQLQSRGVYIAPARSTAFNTAFREFMITRMVVRGADVAVCRVPEGGKAGSARDVEVRYDTQLVVHSSRGVPAYQPPALTLLASGVAVLRNVALRGAEPTVAALGGVALAEWWAGYEASPTRSEIIVTTTIAENNRYVSRQSDVYYIPDGDTKLFEQAVLQRPMCPSEKTPEMVREEREAGNAVAQQETLDKAGRVSPWRKLVLNLQP